MENNLAKHSVPFESGLRLKETFWDKIEAFSYKDPLKKYVVLSAAHQNSLVCEERD